MDIYFTKATYFNNIYKISDFFSGSTYVQNANKKLSVNLKANDGLAEVVTPSDQLPDATYIRDYTHVMIPSMTKIYEITSFEYINSDQVRLMLMEDAMIGNYEELKTKKIMLNRSNDSGKFLGLNDIKDVAIKHTASVTYGDVPAQSTGPWMLFTFQGDAGEIEFEFGDLANYPVVGTFASTSELSTAFPEATTDTPFSYDYYLKFATISGVLYQCVYDVDALAWVVVYKPGSYDLIDGGSITLRDRGIIQANSLIALTGDLNTINVVLPLDATIARYVTTNNGTFLLVQPSFYHYKSNNQPDKLLSIRLIPEELLGDLTVVTSTAARLEYITKSVSSPYYMTGTATGSTYFTKQLLLTNTKINMETFSSAAPGWSLPMFTATQFKDEFSFAQSGVTYSYDHEPFKKYFLSFYGALVPIPARYVSSFNVRLGLTATSILFEVYTDRYNIIGSGDLQWFTRFSVDTLALYQANNPTYKEQFWTGQISNAIRSVGGGAVGGFVAGGPVGAAAGLGAGAANALMSTVTGSLNMHWMEKGLKDVADQIQGINDVALSLIKGFAAYIITVVPESEAVSQMKSSLELVGFPASSSATIATLTAFNVASLGLGASKLIVGKLLETVKNSSVTRMIDTKLMEGVIII